MKKHFIRLLNYDHYTNQVILDTLLTSGATAKPVKLMAHLLASQQVWLQRCKNEPAYAGTLWPDVQLVELHQWNEKNHAEWLGFLESLQDGDFDQIVDYKNSKGEAFSNTLSDILAHIINHGTHHRAQAGQYLKQDEVPLPFTDYIFYVRQL